MNVNPVFDAMVSARIKSVMDRLAFSGAHIAAGKHAAARDYLQQANVELTALRVAIDQALGPLRLPRRPQPMRKTRRR